MNVLELQKKLQTADLPRLASNAIRRTSSDLVEWQKEQLWSGKTSTGAFIRPPYRPLTKIIKRRKGQPTDRVTLKDTGDFYDMIVVDVGLDTWNLTSEDYKNSMLTEKYSDKIFGLNKISLQGYRDDVKPVFLNEIEKATGL